MSIGRRETGRNGERRKKKDRKCKRPISNEKVLKLIRHQGTTNQKSQEDNTPYPSGQLKLKRLTVSSVTRTQCNGSSHTSQVGVQAWYTAWCNHQKTVQQSPLILKLCACLPATSAIPPQRRVPTDTYVHVHQKRYTKMFIAALFLIGKTRKYQHIRQQWMDK